MSKEYKGKDETKVINLIRFAYDIFRYSALKFKVPSQTIAKFEGPVNDYGCSDFIPVVSRLVLKHQINTRNTMNAFLKNHFKPHMRNSLDHIIELFGKVNQTRDKDKDIISSVEFSLAAVCELIIFLYSENSSFFPVQLAELWFQFCLRPNNTKFKKRGALNRMYKKGKEMQRNVPDAFVNTFIMAICSNYQNSVKVDLYDKYYDSLEIYKKKQLVKSVDPSEDSPLEIDLPHYIYHSAQDEDLGVNLPPNPGLGVPTPEEIYGGPLAGDEPLFQNIPEENVDLSKRAQRPSYKDRKENRRTRSRSSKQQGLGQASTDSPVATDATKSYDLQGVRRKEPAPKPSGLQTGASGLCSSEAERFERLSLGSSTKEHRESKSTSVLAKYLTPPERSLETQSQAQRVRRLLDLTKSIGSNETKDIGQLSSDSSVLKQSSKEKSDIIFLENPDEIRQEPTKENSESSSEEETEERETQEE